MTGAAVGGDGPIRLKRLGRAQHRTEHEARGGEVAATAEICDSPDAQAVLASANVRPEMALVRLKGIDEAVRIYRLRPLDPA